MTQWTNINLNEQYNFFLLKKPLADSLKTTDLALTNLESQS